MLKKLCLCVLKIQLYFYFMHQVLQTFQVSLLWSGTEPSVRESNQHLAGYLKKASTLLSWKATHKTNKAGSYSDVPDIKGKQKRKSVFIREKKLSYFDASQNQEYLNKNFHSGVLFTLWYINFTSTEIHSVLLWELPR